MRLRTGRFKCPVQIYIDVDEFLFEYGEDKDHTDTFEKIKEIAEDAICKQAECNEMTFELEDYLVLNTKFCGDFKEEYYPATRLEPAERNLYMDELNESEIIDYIKSNMPDELSDLIRIIRVEQDVYEMEIDYD